MNVKKVLVVGATGATGKHVVQQLLDLEYHVKAIVRSKNRMEKLLSDLYIHGTSEDVYSRLTLTEAGLSDLTDKQLEEHIEGMDAVVFCLGHNMSFKGMYGAPQNLVTQATIRFSNACASTSSSSSSSTDSAAGAAIKKPKFILMGSNGVANPNGQDDIRPRWERTILFLLRYLLPPHSDNESAAAHLYNTYKPQGVENDEKNTNKGAGEAVASNNHIKLLEWVVVRPVDLINDTVVSPYTLLDKPEKGLFGGDPISRINVAHFMGELIHKEQMWNKWKYKMPVITMQQS